MNTSDFDFELPAGLIAQEPPAERGQSRMLVMDAAGGTWAHGRVAEIGEYVRAGDVLVLNDTRVLAARLYGVRRDTGGRVEVLLLEPAGASPRGDGLWLGLYRAAGRAAVGQHLDLADGHLRAELMHLHGDGRVELRLEADAPLEAVLDAHGVPPVPPYIRRDGAADARYRRDRERYQTVYARERGAVAAPTAGLHFSVAMLDALRAQGVQTATLTLHVGMGTFKPVKVDRVEDHTMESERYRIPPEAAQTIRAARAAGGRIVAVGSTSMRTLETVVREHGDIIACEGRSTLFIHPPYRFRAADAMLTNFHLPRSTLLMMVSAFAGWRGGHPVDDVNRGRELVLRAYGDAIAQQYRFYSYGDCMLIQ